MERWFLLAGLWLIFAVLVGAWVGAWIGRR